MSRRDARRHAFFLIFQFPFHQPFDGEMVKEAHDLYMDDLPDGEKPRGNDASYVERVAAKTFGYQSEIDGMIEKYLKDWRIDRINKIDLALLRLGVCELMYEDDIPAGATVNEVVELAKTYGADESPSFINGVLGGVSRSLIAEPSET